MNSSDAEFLSAFENCTLPKSEFRHQAHLRICWLYLSAYPFEDASEKIKEGIIRFATSLGAIHIYHVSLTQAWVHLVALAMKKNLSSSFEEFIQQHPYLLDKSLPAKYYSQTTLSSEAAKTTWVAPDLRAFE